MGISDTSLDCLLNRCGSCHYFQTACREFRVLPGGKIRMKYESNNGKCKLISGSQGIGAHSSCLYPGGKRMYKLWLELPLTKL